MEEVPENICQTAELISMDLLPAKSKEKYLRAYNALVNWKSEKEISKTCFSEKIMLVYFDHLKQKYKPSTLWVEYSMLRTTIQANDNIDINYPKLHTFLKKNSIGFQAKKSNVFQPHEIRQFLLEANDSEHSFKGYNDLWDIWGNADR